MSDYAEQFLANARREVDERRKLEEKDNSMVKCANFAEDRERADDRHSRDKYRDLRNNDRERDRYRDRPRNDYSDRRSKYGHDDRRGDSYRRNGGRHYGGRDRDRDRDRDTHRDRGDRSDYRPRSRSPQRMSSSRKDIQPINEWDRSNSKWDRKPEGYENVSADMAKLSDVFPSPSNPRPDLDRLRSVLISSGGNGEEGTAVGPTPGILKAADPLRLLPSRAKIARTVFVSVADAETTKLVSEIVASGFNSLLNTLEDGVIETASPIVDASVSEDHTVVALECATPEIATLLITFDQSLSTPEGGRYSIFRPSNYIVPTVLPDDHPDKQDTTSKIPKDSPTKITLSNIPTFLDADQVRELLVAFGELDGFLLLKNKGGDSQGRAFAEFKAAELSDIVLSALNGMKLGENELKAQKSCKGVTQDAELAVENVEKIPTFKSEPYTSPVIQLDNMVTLEEINNSEEYHDILSQVEEYCTSLNDNKPVTVKIPKKLASSDLWAARVFVKFADNSLGEKACIQLGGSRFNERTVITSFYDETNFNLGIFV